VTVKQESIPWQSFVFGAVRSFTIRNTSLGPPKRGLGGGDFHFSDNPAAAEVCPMGQVPDLPNWLCLLCLAFFNNYPSQKPPNR
jgi:hypothetical protein